MPRWHSSPSPGISGRAAGSGRPRDRGTCQAKLYPHIHRLPPGPQRAVKYSCFCHSQESEHPQCFPSSPITWEQNQRGKEGALPSPGPSHPGATSCPRSFQALQLHSEAEWKPQLSRGFGASLPYTVPYKPRSQPMDADTLHQLISLPFPLIWGKALNSTIKLKVMCPDKSIKTLFATPKAQVPLIRGLASCRNI